MPAKPLGSPYAGILPVLAIALAVIAVFSVRFGAVGVSFSDMISALRKGWSAPDLLNLTEAIFAEIRLPRAFACLFGGASLVMGGVLMQALFRNPIVEPGLVGPSSGAAFGASLYFVLGATLKFHTGEWTLPLAACLGGAVATACVFLVSETTQANRESTTALLLTGIAVNALFLSGVGFFSYIARDPQARSITFWNLGTLSGANWRAVIILAVVTIVGLAVSLPYPPQLNFLMMGEGGALCFGVDAKPLKATITPVHVFVVC